jgi:FtsZ-binding cell division protein ZapB
LQANCKQKKASKQLEKLNQAKEQIEAIQKEIDEMKEQENSSLWQDSPLRTLDQTEEPRKKIFREYWNLTVRGSKITTIHRAANCTVATEVQNSFSPEV